MSERPPKHPQVPAPLDSPEDLSDELLDEEGGESFDGVPGAPSVVAASRCESLQVPVAAHGQRLDAFLGAQITAYSRSHLKSLIEAGCVSVSGQVVSTPSRKVAQGQQIEVQLRPTAQSLAFVAEPMALPIVFEDAHLLVIDKPAGLVVHPAAGNWQGTLMNGLLAHHAGASALPRAGIVHRLDKDTSGLMVVGKTLEAVTALSRAIAAREVTRQYLALVHGLVDEAFSVSTPIGRDPVTRVRMAVVASGKPARTDVRCLLTGDWGEGGAPPSPKRAPQSGAQPGRRAFSGVLCTLHTGRTHQIRVHLSSRKHPLVADALYGGAPALGMRRQALHAARLSFLHPVNGEPLAFQAALPADMAQAWAALEEGATWHAQTGV
ncbi:MAG: RluA family pseudouridine synthase [Proteobacteria bacterium]|uniref:RluA family pseudouridine synthase n=1 Tax=Aquabacterium sp. TaxID=1872578 RepID=UPI0035C731C0|nr:RluA family pseudouridine synthase [Pseudomonadota bacterium]